MTPSSVASLTMPSGTARVPPIGYQMPSSICMWPIEKQDGGRGIGRGADVLDEVVEHLRGVGVGNLFADDLGDRLAEAHAHDVLQDLDVERALNIHGIAHGTNGTPEEEAVGDAGEAAQTSP